jgi:hypothetical protein
MNHYGFCAAMLLWLSVPVAFGDGAPAAEPSKAMPPKVVERKVESTLVFDDPIELKWPEDAPPPAKPLMPLLTSWDSKDYPDLLVGDGSGKIWLVRMTPAAKGVTLKSAEPIKADERAIRFGGACQPNWVDMNGDGLPELVVAWERHVMMFPNAGAREKPSLRGWTYLRTSKGPLILPEKTAGRLEVADWNRDGLPDLIATDFDGVIYVHLNSGSRDDPLFSTPMRVSVNNQVLRVPYAPYVRFTDINGDGIPDLVAGLNWGYIAYFPNASEKGMPVLRSEQRLNNQDSAVFDARKLTTDNIFCAFARLKGDHAKDMIFGGSCDKLFYAAGLEK